MKTIYLTKILCISDIQKDYHLEDKAFIHFSIGSDCAVYLLFSKNPPKRISGMFVDIIANTEYTTVVLFVDWNRMKLIGSYVYSLGILKPNFHFLQPFQDNFLLLGARSYLHQNGVSDNNAFFVDKKGHLIKELCLGDGILDCVVTEDNHIITSYFDEGIFGNHGWTIQSAHVV